MQDTVLFLHSTGTAPSMWNAVSAEDLVSADGLANLRKVSPANIGYPPNALLQRGEAFQVQDEIGYLLKLFPHDAPLHIVAHSYGGLVALKIAQLQGLQVKSLLLFEPVLFGALNQMLADNSAELDAAAAKEVNYFHQHPWFLNDEERGGKEEWQEAFIDYWNKPGAWRSMPESLQRFCLAVGFKMFREVQACMFENKSFADYRFKIPMTLIMGERSPAASRAMAKALAHENPQASLIDWPKANHMSPLTQGPQVREKVLEHLKRIGVL